MRIIKALKTINYRLLLAVFAAMLLPTIYQTVRIYFLGNLPSDGGINIASQLSWVNRFQIKPNLQIKSVRDLRLRQAFI